MVGLLCKQKRRLMYGGKPADTKIQNLLPSDVLSYTVLKSQVEI